MWRRPLSSYEVDMHLCGRHPYLKETHLDYEDRDITVTVSARDFNHAEKVALFLPHLPKAWSRWVTGVRRTQLPARRTEKDTSHE